MKKESGVTLITLIIAIIILIILAGIGFNAALGEGGILDQSKQAKEEYEYAQGVEGDGVNKAQGILTDILAENNGPAVKNPREEIAGDGSYIKVNDVKANSPKLAEGMEAIVMNPDGSDRPATSEEDWYDYSTNKWANAKTTEDGSFWVWIPRYEYKIDYTGVPQNGSGDHTKAGTIDIRFIDASTKTGATGYTTTNGITTKSDGYIIHPAFTNDSGNGYANGGWDSEIPGFWVAKYEMSMENGSGTHVATSSGTIGNVALSTSVKAVSKPGVSSWRNINIANCYQNAYNYDTSREKESHLMKNSEWGAVAYLTHSQYGRNGIEITINNSSTYITGNAGNIVSAGSATGITNAYNTIAGALASSTGNMSGIYDLSGGANEYVAAYNKAYSGTYFTGTSYKNAEGTHFASTGGSSTKYVTTYSNSTGTYYATNLSDFTSGGRDVSHTGDAIHEVWIKTDYGWLSDYSNFVTSDHPFFRRGRSLQ